jgi:hypothetical protein
VAAEVRRAPSVAGVNDRPLADLPLRKYHPVPRLVVPVHEVTRARFPAVDAHNHLGRWASSWAGLGDTWTVTDVAGLLQVMDACNLRAVVNLDGRWGSELEENLNRYDRAHPGRFATCCHLDWSEAASPGFGERLAALLRNSVRIGAKGLKVWKDLGLHVRDDRGQLILPDDHRLAPVWGTAAELEIPVFIHTADPVAFFDPPDARNERLEQLLAHPEWFAHPSFPRFERLIDSLEALVAGHKDTTFVAVHVGGYAENLQWVSRMLDVYPNFHVDIAARVAELGRQPRAARADHVTS